MTVYAIAQGRVTDPAQMALYVEAASPTLDQYGGTVVVFDETPDIIEGEMPTPRTVVIRFASAEAFHTWYDSPEYTAARRLRETAVVGSFILVQGLI